MKHAVPLVFFPLLAIAASPDATEEMQPLRMAVTDLQVIDSASEQGALQKCHAMNGSYVSAGVDWTMGAAKTARFTQLCKQRQWLEGSYAGDVVQRIRVLSSTCPESASPGSQWTTLHTPRAGVVVCMLKTSAQRAQQLNEFLVDIDVTRTQFYNDALPQWTTLRDTSIHEWRNAAQVKPYTGVYMSVRQPPSSIASVSVVPVNSTSPDDESATACGDAEDIGRLFSTKGDTDAVVCISRLPVTERGNSSRIVDVDVVDVEEDCEDGEDDTETTKKALTNGLALCVTSSNQSANTSYISDLRVERWSAAEGSVVKNVTYETERFITAVEKSGFELVETPTPLEKVSSTASEPFLFLRRVVPAQNLTVETSMAASSSSTKPPLKARESDGGLTFKILQLADLHYSGDVSTVCRDTSIAGCTEATMTTFVGDLLDLEKPDFVVLTGDNVQTQNASLHQAAMDAAMGQLEKRSLPYALIFGNHDDENGFSREELIQKAMEKPHSYTQRGPSQVDGVGNYQLTVEAPVDGVWGSTSSSVFRMYFLDSHAYIKEDEYALAESVYDWIKPRQVQFFQQLSSSVTRVPAALMFFHIPLPEYAAAPMSNDALVEGGRREAISSGTVNSHLFSALVDQGEVKATFIGHDHVNDYCYKREGIQLCYGGGAGFGQAYGDSSMPRRARVIEWSVNGSNQRQIRTWKRLHDKLSMKRDLEILYSEAPASAVEAESDSLVVLYCGLIVVLSIVVGIGAWIWFSRNDLYIPVQVKTTPVGKETMQSSPEVVTISGSENQRMCARPESQDIDSQTSALA